MKVGVFPPFANPFCTPEHVSAVGRAVDERGFSSLWVAEHVVLFDEYASQYPYLESGRFPRGPTSAWSSRLPRWRSSPR